MQNSVQKSKDLTPEEELIIMDDKTDRGGQTEVSLDRWKKLNENTVRVWFWIPTGDRVYEDMRWPDPGQDMSKYKFVRLLHDVGLSLGVPEFEHAEDTTAKKIDGRWLLEVSKYSAHEIHDLSIRDRISYGIRDIKDYFDQGIDTGQETNTGTLRYILLSALVVPLLLPISVTQLVETDSERAKLFLSGVLCAILWGGMLLALVF